MFKLVGNFELNTWYKMLMLFGIIMVLFGGVFKEDLFIVLGLGSFIFTIGIWKDIHKGSRILITPNPDVPAPNWQEKIKDEIKNFSLSGALLNLIGLVLIIYGMYKFLWHLIL